MNEAQQSTLDLRRYAQVLWRHKLMILQFVVLLPALVLGLSLNQHKVYDAKARVIVESQAATFNAVAGQNIGDKPPDDRLVATAADFVTTPEVAGRVIKQLSLQVQPATLISNTVAKPDANANVIVITTSDRSPEQAAALANAFAEQFVEWRKEQQQAQFAAAIQVTQEQLAAAAPGSTAFIDLVSRRNQLHVLQALSSGGVSVGELALVPGAPARPKPLRNTAVAFAIALVLGFGGAFLRESLDVKVHSIERLQELTALPVIGTIGALPQAFVRSGKLVTLEEPRGPAAESYRFLRTSIGFMNFNKDIKSILVTSPLPGQGKSTTVANLAVVMLRSGLKVAVVEGDLRRPAQHRFFQVGNGRGVTSVIAGTSTLADSTHMLSFRDGSHLVTAADGKPPVQATGKSAAGKSSQLKLLTSGPLPPNPGELITSNQLGEIIKSFEADHDYVLVDAPPLFAVGDASTLAGRVDGVLIVINLEQTTKEMLRRVEEFCARIPARKLGLVVTGLADGKQPTGYGDYYQ